MMLPISHHLSQRLQAFFCQLVSVPTPRKTCKDLQLPSALQQTCVYLTNHSRDAKHKKLHSKTRGAPAECRKWRLSDGRKVKKPVQTLLSPVTSDARHDARCNTITV